MQNNGQGSNVYHTMSFGGLYPIANELLGMSVLFASWQSTIIRMHKKDGTPVSNADKNIQRFVKNCLLTAYPEIPVCGEEDDCLPSRMVRAGTHWSVDPIDGTRYYEAKKDEWCISIALIVAGVPYAGIIIQPSLRECFIGIRGKGVQSRSHETAWVAHSKMLWADVSTPMLIVPTSQSVFRNQSYVEQAGRLTLAYENTFSAPSVSAGLEIVRGRAWGWASLFEPWHWDIAASYILVKEIGGAALCANGQEIPWHKDRMPPVVFARTQKEAEEICSVLRGEHIQSRQAVS